jgi:hypothetical protein
VTAANALPPLSVLEAHFRLDRSTGDLIRLKTYRQHKAGVPVGTRMKSGHLSTSVQCTRYLVHRIVYFMATGVDPGEMLVDHINGDPADNRPENLRLATKAQNSQHKVKRQANNASGHRNVSWNNHWQRWTVSVRCNGKAVRRNFVSKEDAIKHAAELRRSLYGEFEGLAA